MTPDQDPLQLGPRLAEAEQRIARLEQQFQALAAVGPVAWKLRLEERNWGIPRALADQVHLGVCICTREFEVGKLPFSPKDELALVRIPGGANSFEETRWDQQVFDAWAGGAFEAPLMHVHADRSGLLEFGIDLSRHSQSGSLHIEIVEGYVLSALQLFLSHSLTLGVPGPAVQSMAHVIGGGDSPSLTHGLTGPAIAAVAISGVKGLTLGSRRRAWDMIPRDRRFLGVSPLRVVREIALPQDAAHAEHLAGEILVEICLAFNQPVQGTWQFLPTTS